MTFWSGEKLKQRLPALLGDYYDENRIDCASYRLRVGSEIYVTPSEDSTDWRKRTKVQLEKPGQECIIPPGQFAFILTEEIVKVPKDAIALISMRSGSKFLGLVNVSGFHVDPGYENRLIFAVFNAGPGDIHVQKGEELFVIFYADLDVAAQGKESAEVKKPGDGYSDIPSKLINPIAERVWSFGGLNSKIEGVDEKLSERMSAIERDNAVSRWATALLIGALIALGVKTCAPTTPSNPPAIVAPVQRTSTPPAGPAAPTP